MLIQVWIYSVQIKLYPELTATEDYTGILGVHIAGEKSQRCAELFSCPASDANHAIDLVIVKEYLSALYLSGTPGVAWT